MLQQGDVILIPVQKIPKGAHPTARRADGRAVLAEGEVTGHAHVITAPAEVTVELVERDGVTYLRTSGPSDLVHEEHRPVSVPPGNYEVRRVREYDHFAEEARFVAD